MNMLIKFSKQIGSIFAKIINTKVNSKLCQTAEIEFFPQVVTGFRSELSCHISKMDLFAKIVKNGKRLIHPSKGAPVIILFFSKPSGLK